jgi:hypothetical protein
MYRKTNFRLSLAYPPEYMSGRRSRQKNPNYTVLLGTDGLLYIGRFGGSKSQISEIPPTCYIM